MFIGSGPSESNRYWGAKFSWGFEGLVRPPVGPGQDPGGDPGGETL